MSRLLQKFGLLRPPTTTYDGTASYRPLDTERKEIRVLDLHGTDERGRVRCSLRHISLLEVPPPHYETLSWSWGKSKETKKILLHGQLVSVPANAEEILRRIGIDRNRPCLWLDAICINQLDIAERSQQVAMMKDVYQKSACTLIWLGDANSSICRRVESSFEMVLTQCRKYFNDDAEMLSMVFAKNMLRYNNSIEPLPKIDWTALGVFFERSWFTRVWVIQEVALSRRNLCFFGNTSRPWSDIETVAVWLHYRGYSRPEHSNKDLRGIPAANTHFMLRVGMTQSELGATFEYKLQPLSAFAISQQRDCTVPHDKIYGMLGLLQHAHPDSMAGAIVPDYTLPLEEVYTIATRCMFEEALHRGCLLVIERAQRLVPPAGCSTSSSARWPSWVPRYDWVEDYTRGSYSSPSATPSESGERSSACKDHKLVIRDLHQDAILSIQGLVVDTIMSAHGQVGVFGPQTMKEDIALYLEWRSLALEAGNREIDVALTGTMGNTNLFGHDYHALFSAYQNYVWSCENPVAAGWLKSGFWLGAETIKDSGDMEKNNAVAYRHHMWASSHWNRFCLTDRGMLAMAAPNVRQGDHVCILLGCRFPFILRQEGQYWRLIGTAYVHLLMDGEYVQQLEHERRFESEKRWFDIH